MLPVKNSFTGKGGFYASIDLCDSSRGDLIDALDMFSIPYDPRSDFHVTLVYSPVGIPKSTEIPDDLNKRAFAEITGYDLFGDNKNILVIKLKCLRMNELFEHFSGQGACHTYEVYRPHATLRLNYKPSTKIEKDFKLFMAYFKGSYKHLTYDSFTFQDI